MSTLLQKVRTVMRMPLSSVVLAVFTWFLLWIGRFVILVVPLKYAVRLYGFDQGAHASTPIVTSEELNRAGRVYRAIALAGKYSPSDSDCYAQALASRFLLSIMRVPHGLFFGVELAAQTNEMKAHAWTMVGPLPVSGGNGFADHTVVRCFTSFKPDCLVPHGE